MKLWNHFYLMGVAASVILGLFFALAFLRQRAGNKRANKLLGLLMITVSMSVFFNATVDRLFDRRFAFLLMVPEPFLLAIGPLFLAYVQALTGQFKLRLKDGLHLLPFLLLGVVFVSVATSDENAFNEETHDLFAHLNRWIWLGIYLHFWIYYGLNRRALKAYQTSLKQAASSLEKVYQSWISICLTAFLVIYSMLGLLFLLGHGRIFVPINQSLATMFAVFIYLIGFRVLLRPEIFAYTNIPLRETQPTRDEPKYHKSGLDPHSRQLQWRKIHQLMTEQKPFLDPDLDLAGLAVMVGLSSHHLSQMINEQAGSNFYDFVNQYRIEEVKRLMADPAKDHLTLLSLAMQAGFNSKATFNRVFKKTTQKTPSQFRKGR